MPCLQSAQALVASTSFGRSKSANKGAGCCVWGWSASIVGRSRERDRGSSVCCRQLCSCHIALPCSVEAASRLPPEIDGQERLSQGPASDGNERMRSGEHEMKTEAVCQDKGAIYAVSWVQYCRAKGLRETARRPWPSLAWRATSPHDLKLGKQSAVVGRDG